MRVLLVDNYDSFTWNLAHLLAEVTGELPIVRKNDELTITDIAALGIEALVLSPGPGHPERDRDFGICKDLLTCGDLPLLGICLGHQGIAHFAGGSVAGAKRVVHGLTSPIHHDGRGLFAGIPDPFVAVRYHSLAVEEPLPPELELLAWTAEGEVMALRHKSRPFWGVQFHPESACSEYGRRLLANFLEMASEFGTGRSVRRRKLSFYAEPEDVFTSLFASDENSFWLDTSLVQSGRSCYSYMGGSSIQGSYLLEYRTAGQQLTLRKAGHSEQMRQSIFDYLAAELKRLSAPAAAPGFHGGFAGYLGYEMKGECGYGDAHTSCLPDAAFLYTPLVIAFQLEEQVIELFAISNEGSDQFDAWEAKLRCVASGPAPEETQVAAGRLRHQQSTYEAKVRECISEIRAGESYEICLTNTWETRIAIDPFQFYRKLRRDNPAPYSAFLRLGGAAIACSSPERFLRIGPDRMVSSKPIKGTLGRAADPAELRASVKDQAEHLMIVDLVRNDLGKVCAPASVQVTRFMDVESYATMHQMVSTIEGKLRDDGTVIDCVRAAFPGGSMTGAPKHRTLEILDRLEEGPRGPYSGAIGYLGLDGCADLNIVIRTAVFAGETMRVGAGGAVTALSSAREEFEEVMLKMNAVIRTAVSGS